MARAAARRRLRAGLGALLVGLSAAGCTSWRVGSLGPPMPVGQPRQIAESVVLQVDEVAVAWSGGRMGSVTRQSLIELGAFREVHYPIEPPGAPSLRLTIEAVGTMQEHYGVGILKSVFIGALFFLPVGVVTFDRDFTVSARAVLSWNRTPLQEIDLTTTARLSATMFHDQTTADRQLADEMFQHLAAQLAVRLQPVSALP